MAVVAYNMHYVNVSFRLCDQNGFSLLLNLLVIRYGVTVDSTGAHIVKKVTEWGKGAGPFTINKGPNSFNIPHGLALAEDRNEVQRELYLDLMYLIKFH